MRHVFLIGLSLIIFNCRTAIASCQNTSPPTPYFLNPSIDWRSVDGIVPIIYGASTPSASDPNDSSRYCSESYSVSLYIDGRFVDGSYKYFLNTANVAPGVHLLELRSSDAYDGTGYASQRVVVLSPTDPVPPGGFMSGSTMYNSNGTQYCYYPTPIYFVTTNGLVYKDTLNQLASIPDVMVYAGKCGGGPSPAGPLLVQQWNDNGNLALVPLFSTGAGFSAGPAFRPGAGFASGPGNTPGLIALDINGDGRMDLVQQWNDNGVLVLIPYIANATGFTIGSAFYPGTGFASGPESTPGLIAMDINGDGKTDLVQQWNDNGVLVLIPFFSTGNGFTAGPAFYPGTGFASGPSSGPGLIAMDINGDGKVDLVQQWNKNGVLVLIPFFSAGYGFTVGSAFYPGTGFASGPGGTPGLIALDINGDGKADLVQQWNNNGSLTLIPFFSNGSGFTVGSAFNPGTGFASGPGGTPGLIALDINGDRKIDLVQQWNNNGALTLIPFLSTGNGFKVGSAFNSGAGFASGPGGTPGLIPMDIDGDGRIDLVQQWNNNGNLTLISFLSTGSSFKLGAGSAPATGYASGPGGTPGLVDMYIHP